MFTVGIRSRYEHSGLSWCVIVTFHFNALIRRVCACHVTNGVKIYSPKLHVDCKGINTTLKTSPLQFLSISRHPFCAQGVNVNRLWAFRPAQKGRSPTVTFLYFEERKKKRGFLLVGWLRCGRSVAWLRFFGIVRDILKCAERPSSWKYRSSSFLTGARRDTGLQIPVCKNHAADLLFRGVQRDRYVSAWTHRWTVPDRVADLNMCVKFIISGTVIYWLSLH